MVTMCNESSLLRRIGQQKGTRPTDAMSATLQKASLDKAQAASWKTGYWWTERLTTPTTPVKAVILTFFHHCCLLTVLAPLLKAYACPANVSVLSTSRSSLSPRCRIESIFCTMISFLHNPQLTTAYLNRKKRTPTHCLDQNVLA